MECKDILVYIFPPGASSNSLRNLLEVSCNPFYSIIQTEESPGVLCSGRPHICPFGTTAYAHVLAELNTSKLHPKSLKVYLIGYYGHEAYKLLDRSTEEIFKSRDVIFKEGSTHYAT